ncbi:galectin-9 [Carettochelys insculpta]|uniref:galectin-9 n=1 Tax=Carettochelys insculpta TaxID=44489 RepID=UPI003EBC6532
MAHSWQQPPYIQPTVPFTGPIQGGLRDGMMVLINGTVLQTCDRFHINFQCGTCQNQRADVAFHFNPRFEEGGYVVCNTFEKQSWGKEERKYEMPFSKGHAFEIRVLVKHDSFLVAVNGNHFVEYKHRIPLSRVDTIVVSGSVQVANISFQNAAPNVAFPYQPQNFPPGAWPTSAGITNADFLSTQFAPGPAYNPNVSFPPGPYQSQNFSVPYHASIVGGLYPSKSVIIMGTVPPDADGFQVNLKSGGNIAFHIGSRFSENAIVRNSFLQQCWGSEERNLPSGMPLVRGQSFTIWILCEAQCFKVAVNGQHQFDYNHRVHNLQQIDKLEIEGDVMLTSVQV